MPGEQRTTMLAAPHDLNAAAAVRDRLHVLR
ncbi:ABC-type hemin transport system ATPase subunit [Nonomuraea endophytica]|uniref:ABC-type hemin transport system ATPase subunit n=1 Tax=Nonomuraea endophytica TaxID=714136 RepID=A0A7W8AC89_9ACTN|nr:ABC-type hemin transport system ATPase subunit [Nonomuraea endophytica]